MAVDTSAVAAKPKRLAIRDAATLVLVDQTGAQPRILMGKRRADLAFMAGKFVFPGGRVDIADKTAPSADELTLLDIERLLLGMRGRPSAVRARGLALAAIRETFEETGLVLGDPGLPVLSCMTFVARAITPPGRTRRYDTRFFMARSTDLSNTTLGGDGELTDLAWFTAEEAHKLDLPGITRLVISDVAERLKNPSAHVPFYDQRAGQRCRDILRPAGV